MPCPNTVLANPSGCSTILSPAVRPRWASCAAVMASRPTNPACSGLVMVPKLWIKPPAMEPAIPRAMVVCCSSSFINLAHAAVLAMCPMTAVAWNPLSIWLYLVTCCKARPISQPTT